MPGTLLSVEGVTRQFGAAKALDDVHLQAGHGEFIALLGPSGCGKTTLLRSIAGFVTPDTGRILIDGRDVLPLPPHKRPLNTVFQQYALFPHMTVLDNTAFGPRRAGASQREAQERAREALAMVDMERFQGRYPRELSGGQQQRVALARAIVNKPRLLLLDEPLSALDMKLRKKMQLELKHLQSRLGVTFVFVTHDQEEAMAMADRIVVMNAGRIEQVGTGEELYRRPLTRFTAEFIGDANFFSCRRDADGTVELDGRLRVRAPDGFQAGATGAAMLRPEALRILGAGEEPGASWCTFGGSMRDRIQLGSHEMAYVEAGGRELIARVTAGHLREQPGAAVRLAFAPEDLHFLAG